MAKRRRVRASRRLRTRALRRPVVAHQRRRPKPQRPRPRRRRRRRQQQRRRCHPRGTMATRARPPRHPPEGRRQLRERRRGERGGRHHRGLAQPPPPREEVLPVLQRAGLRLRRPKALASARRRPRRPSLPRPRRARRRPLRRRLPPLRPLPLPLQMVSHQAPHPRVPRRRRPRRRCQGVRRRRRRPPTGVLQARLLGLVGRRGGARSPPRWLPQRWQRLPVRPRCLLDRGVAGWASPMGWRRHHGRRRPGCLLRQPPRRRIEHPRPPSPPQLLASRRRVPSRRPRPRHRVPREASIHPTSRAAPSRLTSRVT